MTTKVKPVYRIEFLADFPAYGLRIGQVIRTEIMKYGTNWIAVRLPCGRSKTFLNFEAKWAKI